MSAAILGEVYEKVTAAVEPLAPRDFLRPTRTVGWTVQDLLYHQLLDAQRALLAIVSPTDRLPDVDAVTYWQGFRPEEEGGSELAHARWVRIAASAYAEPHFTLVAQWRETSRGAVRGLSRLAPHAVVETQGHAITAADLVSTMVVEAAIHHLDLVGDLPSGTEPVPAALAEVRRVLDGLLGEPVAAAWDDATYALKGTGRLQLIDADRAALGEQAAAFPLLG